MRALELLITLRKAAIEIEASGDKLRLVGPEANLTPQLIAVIQERKPELLVLLNDLSTMWRVLAATGLNDTQIIRLDEALFLFALRKVQRTPTDELDSTWKHYGPCWLKRLEPAACQFVVNEYERRLPRRTAQQGRLH